jgi:hypothetical protein
MTNSAPPIRPAPGLSARLLAGLVLVLFLLAAPARAQEPPPPENQPAPPATAPAPPPTAAGVAGAADKSWAQFQSELRDAIPNFIAENKLRWQRLRIVRRPKQALSGYEADPGLWKNLNDFYAFILNRELDVYEEQEGLPAFFPDRPAYYDFLDTIIPAMRERKFERNRILAYQVHEIAPVPEQTGQVTVLMSVTSDDALPFKKLMIYRQAWIQTPSGWYPGKVAAEAATWWERIR